MKRKPLLASRIDDTPTILRWGRRAVFILLIVVGGIVIFNSIDSRPFAGIPAWYVVLPAVLVLLTENAIKIWALNRYTAKIICYVFDILLLLTITTFTDGALISTLYMIILSEFYLEQTTLTGSIAMCVSGMGTFLITLAVSGALQEGTINVTAIVANAFNDLILITMHFLIFNFTLQIYRKNREVTTALKELEKSNEKLQRATEELKEVAVLEERQRIAKDIHDTVGHAITTIIMQTEAAKLVVETNPEDARRMLHTANLQAKHALEELRESVHLLSGARESATLSQMLQAIVQESTAGTGIIIRTDIEDISLSDDKRRFVCNSLKEGISNGIRHGNATAFYFEFKRKDGMIHFLLSDNGAGADISSLQKGFGLHGMQGRAQALGGNVEFSAEPGEGFEIHITLPDDGTAGEGV